MKVSSFIVWPFSTMLNRSRTIKKGFPFIMTRQPSIYFYDYVSLCPIRYDTIQFNRKKKTAILLANITKILYPSNRLEGFFSVLLCICSVGSKIFTVPTYVLCRSVCVLGIPFYTNNDKNKIETSRKERKRKLIKILVTVTMAKNNYFKCVSQSVTNNKMCLSLQSREKI